MSTHIAISAIRILFSYKVDLLHIPSINVIEAYMDNLANKNNESAHP